MMLAECVCGVCQEAHNAAHNRIGIDNETNNYGQNWTINGDIVLYDIIMCVHVQNVALHSEFIYTKYTYLIA